MNYSRRRMAMAILFAIACWVEVRSSAGASASSEADEIVTMGEVAPQTIRSPAAPQTVRSPAAPRPQSPRHKSAPAASANRARGFRFPVGLSFVSGMLDLADYAEDHTDADVIAWPVALGVAPYYQFAHGSQIGIDIGPAQIVMIDSGVDYWGVPLGLTDGFAFLPRSSISPDARAGIKYTIAGGDWVENSSPGFFGAAGVEFMRLRMVGLGFEVGYDGSEIEMETGETIQPGQVLVSVRAVF